MLVTIFDSGLDVLIISINYDTADLSLAQLEDGWARQNLQGWRS
jgi:hypothetical protein